MTDIRFLKDRVVFDGHAQSIEECDTITTVCDVLKNSGDFKTVRYENGYAEFERVGASKELKFAPSIMDITINFDSNISKVTFADTEWTNSGETINVAVTTQSLFTVTLSNGYVINSVTTDDTSSLGEVTDITDNTFKIEQIASLGATTITITSKQAVTTNIPAGYFTWNGAKRLVHADDLYNSDGTKKEVGATFVEITSPGSASNGTLTQEQLDTLTASKNNKIIFDNEIYYCEDVQHDSGFLVYAHVGRDSAGNTFVKSIGITISTRGWVKVDVNIPENILDGTGTKSVEQKLNSSTTVTDLKTKNANAYALDNSIEGVPYGARAESSATFNGKASATGKRATAMGTNTLAKGAHSTAMGDNSVALGDDSFVSGYATTSKGVASTAIGDQTQALGKAAFSSGILSVAKEEASFANGYNTTANGKYSSSFGSNTTANGESSTAVGDTSAAKGKASFVTGTKNTISETGLSSDASGGYNTVEGKYASAKGASNFIKATYPTDVSGGGGSSSGGSGGSTEEPTETLTPGAYSSVEGNRNTVYGAWSSAKGANNVIYSHCSSSEGYNNIVGTPVTSINDAGSVTASQHAEGANNKVTGDYSHVGGYESEVSGKRSFAHGQNNNVSGDNSVTFGGDNIINGDFSGAIGAQNKVKSDRSFVAGSNNETTAMQATSFGSQNVVNSANGFTAGQGLKTNGSDNDAVFGCFNDSAYDTDKNAIFSVGVGTSDTARSTGFVVTREGVAHLKGFSYVDTAVVRYKELKEAINSAIVTALNTGV